MVGCRFNPQPLLLVIARFTTVRPDSFVPVAGQGYVNTNSWLLFWQYAACFGVELTVNNVAATYFSDEFNLSTSKAGIVASLFGLMNLFARSLGGIWSGGSTGFVESREAERSGCEVMNLWALQ